MMFGIDDKCLHGYTIEEEIRYPIYKVCKDCKYILKFVNNNETESFRLLQNTNLIPRFYDS